MSKIDENADKIDAVYIDGFKAGYSQARFDLEQEPCDDAISRRPIEEIKEIMTDISGKSVYVARMSDIRALPSVTPAEKVGHWLVHRGYNADGFGIEYSCSKCNEWVDEKSRYCPNCGSKMEMKE